MEDQFKEIEGLLETSAQPVIVDTPSKIKKYVKLVFPHVALVAVVCLYAVIGAYIFYRLESPNEDRLKAVGKGLIGDMRERLIGMIREGQNTKRQWKNNVEEELYRFNDKIYKAFKEQYVRYGDVRITSKLDSSEEKDDSDRTKRHRNTKSRGDKGEKMWTASSALFFAATTMATIGYGNIVPATSSGRIACVVFALFGAPLAIITIGDLGKFLSECTIWLYKQMKKGRVLLRNRWRHYRGINKGNFSDPEEQSDSNSHSTLDWEDLVMDKTEVPVLMVFTILLLYIAFGGILFSFLEGWTYMDAFYYSFISLTTIGFGDIVPENHDYIVLMLAYLGVGLAVTTMCIDLVGIQYIQKIHYFGRKFRGTDLLHLLKRKRMIERRLAMGQGEEILQMYIQQIQGQIPETVVFEEKCEEEKCSSHIEWQIDDAMIGSRYCYDYSLAEKVPSPNVLSIRSYHPPSIYSNSSASARSMMFSRYRSRGASWDESGPSLSEHCSLSTEPSVHIRQEYWDNFCSPNPSLTSFEFEFPLPSPDYHGIALSARRSRRIRSCPSDTFDFPPLSQSVRKLSLQQQLPRFSTQHDPLLLPPESFRISEPFMLSKLAAQCDLYDRLACALRFQSPRQSNLAPACEPLCDKFHYPSIRSPDEVREHPGIPKLSLEESPPNSSRSRISTRFNPSLYPIPERRTSTIETKDEGPEPLLKRKKKERLARLNDPLHDVDWLNVSPRTKIIKLVRDDLPKLFAHVRNNSKSTDSNASSVVLVSPRNPIGLACMEDWDSYIRMLEEYNKPYEGVMESTPSTPRMSSPVQAPKTSTLPSTVEAPTTMDSSLRELVLEKPNVLCSPPKLLSPSISPPVTEPSKLLTPPRVVTPITINVEPEFEVLTEECEDGGEHEIIRDESEDSTIDFPVQVNAIPVKNFNDEEEEEILFHYGDSCEPIPVFSVDEQPLDGPSTLTNTLKCPVKYISKMPPTFVVDNFCFICDGDEVSVTNILTDQQWWKQTSSSTRFYFSENMTTFHQVTLLTCRGEMRGAYRSRARGGGITKVALDKVFRVSRFFSCWRTCHAFHRIVSVINPITEDGKQNNSFKKRIFVQYFWRSEKPHDREMVTREYMESKAKISPRHSLAPPSTSVGSRSWYPPPTFASVSTSSQSSHDSLGNISPRSGTSKFRGKFRAVARSLRGRGLARANTSSSLPTRKRFSVDSLP